MITAACRPRPTTSPTVMHTQPDGSDEHVVPVAADVALARRRCSARPTRGRAPRAAGRAAGCAGGWLAPSARCPPAGHGWPGPPGRRPSAAGRRRRSLKRRGCERADVEHAEHPAHDQQRHAEQRAQALVAQHRVDHVGRRRCRRRPRAASRRRYARRTRGRAGCARPGRPPPRGRGRRWPAAGRSTRRAAGRRPCRPRARRGSGRATRRAALRRRGGRGRRR